VCAAPCDEKCEREKIEKEEAQREEKIKQADRTREEDQKQMERDRQNSIQNLEEKQKRLLQMQSAEKDRENNETCASGMGDYRLTCIRCLKLEETGNMWADEACNRLFNWRDELEICLESASADASKIGVCRQEAEESAKATSKAEGRTKAALLEEIKKAVEHHTFWSDPCARAHARIKDDCEECIKLDEDTQSKTKKCTDVMNWRETLETCLTDESAGNSLITDQSAIDTCKTHAEQHAVVMGEDVEEVAIEFAFIEERRKQDEGMEETKACNSKSNVEEKKSCFAELVKDDEEGASEERLADLLRDEMEKCMKNTTQTNLDSFAKQCRESAFSAVETFQDFLDGEDDGAPSEDSGCDERCEKVRRDSKRQELLWDGAVDATKNEMRKCTSSISKKKSRGEQEVAYEACARQAKAKGAAALGTKEDSDDAEFLLLEAEDEITNDRFDECMVLETSDSSDESAWESASEKCDAQAHAVAGMEIVDDFSREEDRGRAAEEKIAKLADDCVDAARKKTDAVDKKAALNACRDEVLKSAAKTMGMKDASSIGDDDDKDDLILNAAERKAQEAMSACSRLEQDTDKELCEKKAMDDVGKLYELVNANKDDAKKTLFNDQVFEAKKEEAAQKAVGEFVSQCQNKAFEGLTACENDAKGDEAKTKQCKTALAAEQNKCDERGRAKSAEALGKKEVNVIEYEQQKKEAAMEKLASKSEHCAKQKAKDSSLDCRAEEKLAAAIALGKQTITDTELDMMREEKARDEAAAAMKKCTGGRLNGDDTCASKAKEAYKTALGLTETIADDDWLDQMAEIGAKEAQKELKACLGTSETAQECEEKAKKKEAEALGYDVDNMKTEEKLDRDMQFEANRAKAAAKSLVEGLDSLKDASEEEKQKNVLGMLKNMGLTFDFIQDEEESENDDKDSDDDLGGYGASDLEMEQEEYEQDRLDIMVDLFKAEGNVVSALEEFEVWDVDKACIDTGRTCDDSLKQELIDTKIEEAYRSAMDLGENDQDQIDDADKEAFAERLALDNVQDKTQMCWREAEKDGQGISESEAEACDAKAKKSGRKVGDQGRRF
jgi:hypothetical protein